MMVKKLLTVLTMLLIACGLWAQSEREVKWDSQSLMIGGKRVVPVMGEVHYSRIPADEWQKEVRKIKEGGVTIIAAYVFIMNRGGFDVLEEKLESLFRKGGRHKK